MSIFPPYPFPFQETFNFEFALTNYLHDFPVAGFANPTSLAEMDMLFNTLRLMAQDPDYAYSAVIAERHIIKHLKHGMRKAGGYPLAKSLALLQRYQPLDYPIAAIALPLVKADYAQHLANRGSFEAWPGRVNALRLFKEHAQDTKPRFEERSGLEFTHITPVYELVKPVALYLVSPSFLGKYTTSLERALAINHYRQSNVLKNVKKEVPPLIAELGVEAKDLDQTITEIIARWDWMKHRDVHLSNALYGKGRREKVGLSMVNSIQNKQAVLERLTQALLSYKPNPELVENHAQMIFDLASHLPAQDTEEPLITLALLLISPEMADKLDLERVVEKFGALNLTDKALKTVSRILEINALKVDEKAWCHALLDMGLKREVMSYLEKTYPIKKDLMLRLDAYEIGKDTAKMRTLTEDVFMEDLGM